MHSLVLRRVEHYRIVSDIVHVVIPTGQQTDELTSKSLPCILPPAIVI